MTLTTLRLSSAGQTAAYRDVGQGAPLLLIHGVGMQSAAWGPQLTALGETHRVIAVDLPGHGGSARLPTDGRLPDYVAWLHDFAKTLGIGPCSIAGHSMGALIAGGYAIEHPDQTERVALLSGVYRRNAQARAAVIARAAEISAGKIDLQTPIDRWFEDGPRHAIAKQQVTQWLSKVEPSGYATAYSAFARGDAVYADRFAEISCPFLAITGDGDLNSTPDMSQKMASVVQNGHAVTVKGHRHMVNLTAPNVVTAHLAAWLNDTAAQKVAP
ncbi:MAG: alpha/beta hydrolase [Paracoccaceae bacterium]